MASVGPGFVYAVLAVAVFVAGLVVSLVALLLEPWSASFPRAVASCLGGLLALGVAAAILNPVDPAAVRTPLLVAAGYALVPTTVATVLLAISTRHPFGDTLRLAIGSWLGTLVLVFLPGIASNPLVAGDAAPVFALIDSTPSLFGVAWFSGFLALMTGVGVVSALLGRHWAGTQT